MKVLIFGGSGLLGQHLNIAANEKFNILTVYNTFIGNCSQFHNIKADIKNNDEIRNIFLAFKPQVVVNLAGITSHADCNKLGKDTVYKINVESAQNIAKHAQEFNAKLIYTSTDLVYKDDSGGMLNEDSETEPKSIYAESKLIAENAIKEVNDNYIILRTALMYGFGLTGKQNFFSYMYDKLKKREPIKLFSDQYRTAMPLRYAAKAITRLCAIEAQNCIVNFGGSERLSRYDTGRILANVMNLEESLVEPCSMYDNYSPDFAADVSMNTDKLQSLGITIPPYEESVKEELKLVI